MRLPVPGRAHTLEARVEENSRWRLQAQILSLK
jgi:hypothetical protein